MVRFLFIGLPPASFACLLPSPHHTLHPQLLHRRHAVIVHLYFFRFRGEAEVRAVRVVKQHHAELLGAFVSFAQTFQSFNQLAGQVFDGELQGDGVGLLLPGVFEQGDLLDADLVFLLPAPAGFEIISDEDAIVLP